MMNKAVFLDRDGVLNKAFVRDGKPYPPTSIQDVSILNGVEESLRSLKSAGFFLLVVTNQPDVARGKTSHGIVESIHEYLLHHLLLDRIYVCYHDNSDQCACRKPMPGLLHKGAQEFKIDLAKSYMIGDRWVDMAAGVAAGCKTLFIDYGYQEKRPLHCDKTVSSLVEATETILKWEL